MHAIHVVDSHTGGEPTRTVVSGFPDLGAGPVSAQLARLRDSHDRYRRAVVGEPRSSDVAVGALLLPPDDAGAVAGVVFFNNAGYLGMCGHGAIGVIATLAHLGRIAPGTHRLDTPVGRVAATLHESGDVSIENVPAFRHRVGVVVAVPGVGEVMGDVAWGGNWFFLVRSPVVEISASRVTALSATAGAIQSAVDAAGVRGADGARIDHIELFADSPTPGCHSRNFVRCPGGEYDRSPCGTGTSAKLACLAADGALAPGDTWRQESIIGSVFQATYRWEDGHEGTRILPTIRGRAHICAEGDLLLDPSDPFCWGIGP